MDLTRYLFLATLYSIILGSFGHFPFGVTTLAFSATDLLLGTTILWFAICKVTDKSAWVIPGLFKALLVFGGVAGVSWLLSARLLTPGEMVPGFLYWLRFLAYCLVLPISHELVESKQMEFKELIKTHLLIGLILAALGSLQLAFLPDLGVLYNFGFDDHKGRLASTFLDPNFLGTELVLVIGLLLIYWDNLSKKLRWGFLGVLGLALLLTFSRSAYLMMGVFSLVVGFKSKKLLLGVIVAGFLALTLVPRFGDRIRGGVSIDDSARYRLESWQIGLRLARTNPFSGVGFNNTRVFKVKLGEFSSLWEEVSHSSGGVDSGFIFVLATTGVVGLLSYLWFWLKALQRAFGSSRLGLVGGGLLVGLLFNGQFINSLFYPAIMLVYFSLLGAIDSDKRSLPFSIEKGK